MFLRRNRRKASGETYEYWTLVETVRTARGPRQRVVASLRKAPGLERTSRHRWEDITDLLEGRVPARQLELSESPEEQEAPPEWTEVDLRGLRVERVRGCLI